ncbi:SF1B family DNA helicase RecD2 [Salisediminibacterium beveridgei]|uniref:ATP-dependent RecD2 DNA helicase n=1 Tax=Salisediminibacterium beveridgei TaxID=632773 RepID=A0A1D7QU13_9BACI|nr:ATP-dependent RecD-like DNA helicase [Salisediminibacterium beveridgei]AOM82501.1 RecD-like DNA helicase YrrC [Salisediminibacterium beveridgei]
MVDETNLEQEFIQGELIQQIFHAPDSLYTVAKFKVKKSSETIEERDLTVVGMMKPPENDMTYRFEGRMTEHPVYGPQFKFDRYETVLPETKEGIILYLSSERFEGIGRKTAESIVKVLGETAISKILENKKVLDDVPGMNQKKAAILVDQLREDQGIEVILTKLYEYGFGVKMALKVYQTYQEAAVEKMEKNPYELVEDVEGIGFQKADQIGRKQGLTANHPDRLKAGILFTLQEETFSNGHTYIEDQELIRLADQLLSQGVSEAIDVDLLARQLLELEEEDKLRQEDGRFFMPSLYHAERGIVTHLDRLINRMDEVDTFPEAEIYKALGEVEEELGITYADSQREAVIQGLHSPVMILTGGPGTGKTTVIKGIVNVYGKLKGQSVIPEEYGKNDAPFPIVMAAPTGRAAKRMTESTQLPASTIHRLLGYKGEKEGYFEKDDEDPIDGEVLIIDEVSMVDTWLMNQLLKATPTWMQVIFVGDEDQLPSVGPGQVLEDMLASGAVSSVKLVEIFRQAEGSKIIEFSHQIKQEQLPQGGIDKENKDLRFFPCQVSGVQDTVKQVCLGAIKKGFRASDIQVLAPMYKGDAGVNLLNDMLQELFNPPSEKVKEVRFGDAVYRVGDMVLQLINDPENNVFNGDRGEIVAIMTEKETADKMMRITISFNGEEVDYLRNELNAITLAYCCSIHKSQGSEFPIVVMPVVRSYWRMLRKKLIYTGVTRASAYLILCGEWSALEKAVVTGEESPRRTTLKERLQKSVSKNRS